MFTRDSKWTTQQGTDSMMARISQHFDDYWNEICGLNEYRKAHDTSTEDQLEEEDSKTPDEYELDLSWLRIAGFKQLVSQFEGGQETNEEELFNECNTLTRSQTAAVKKRVKSLNNTIRRKNTESLQHAINVQNVFDENSQRSEEPIDLPKTKPVRKSHSFKKTSQQYDMSGQTDEIQGCTNPTGVKPLSINQRSTFRPQRSFSMDQSAQSAVSTMAVLVADGQWPIVADDIFLNFDLQDSPRDAKLEFSVDNNNTSNEDDLPNYAIPYDKLGLTTIDDISAMDKTRVRAFALIELSSLFDIYNISYSKRKVKKKFKESGLFGVPLHILLEHDQLAEPRYRIPIIFQKLISVLESKGLDVEGILRIPGSTTRVKKIQQSLEESFYTKPFPWDEVTVHDVATLFKQFLRELPTPLLSAEYVQAFIKVEAIPVQKQQIQALNLLILLLPDVYRNCLKLLLKFLEKIVENKKYNKMSLSNIAMIMAPNLFMTHSKNNNIKNREVELEMANKMSLIVKLLVGYHDILWTVPSFMITQIRAQYEREQMKKNKDKSLINFFTTKKEKDDKKTEVDMDGVIRIQAPDLTKISTFIKIEDSMTSGDIVAKFKKKSATKARKERESGAWRRDAMFGCYNPMDVAFAADNTYLFEVGGNIGERCLNHHTDMNALYRVNPRAEWIIKDISS